MDTKFLETFICVIESGSIAEAARRSNISAAAIAQRIQSLEAEIGSPLFSRFGRTVIPTEAAGAILGRARELVREARDLRAIARGKHAGGELRLGATSSTMTGVVPGALALLERKNLNINVRLVLGNSDELYAKVAANQLDAAFVAESRTGVPKSCGWCVLREEPLVLLAPMGLKVPDPNDTLRSRPFIRYDRSSAGGRLADSYLKKYKIHPKERFELYGLHAIAVMVSHGLGVSIVPDWAPPWPALAIKKVPLSANPFVRRIGFLWSRGAGRDRLAQTLLEHAITSAHAGGEKRRSPGGIRA
jgi:DNA-binding transcriptional LysR family regulator